MGGAGHVERGCFYASEGRSRLSCLACSRAYSRSEGAWEKGQSRVLTWSRPSLEPKRPGQDEALECVGLTATGAWLPTKLWAWLGPKKSV